MNLADGIRELAASGLPFTADDLVALVGVPDNTHSPNSSNSAVGSAFRNAANAGVIQRTGNVQRSRQPHRKGGMVQEWVGVTDTDGRLAL